MGVTESDVPAVGKSRDPDISVVIPVYRSAGTLRELHRRLTSVLETLSPRYEIIFVDDACPENSWATVEQLAAADPRVGALALERNQGQQRAVMVGLGQARGRVVVVLDADLQDPPEAIPGLVGKLREGPAAVFAGRRGRYESAIRLITSGVFKRTLHLLCGVPVDAGLFVAMSRLMIDHLLSFEEPRPFVPALIGRTGLRLASIPVRRAPRLIGRSAYSTWRRVTVGCRALRCALRGRARAERGQPRRLNAPPVCVRAYLGVLLNTDPAQRQLGATGAVGAKSVRPETHAKEKESQP